MVNRRQFLGLGAATALAGCASFEDVTPRVLIIGAGFGGATCAKYLAMGDPRLQVVLVDRVQEFVSCPMSNLVVGGSLPMAQLTQRIDGLKKYRVDVLWGEAVAVDPARKVRSEEHTSELQSLTNLVFRLLLEKKKTVAGVGHSHVHRVHVEDYVAPRLQGH